MTVPYTIIRRFLFELVGTTSLDRNYRQVINLLLVLYLFCLYLTIVETEKKYYNFGTFLEVNPLHWQLIADHNE